jgi:aldose 1-epimerase
MYVEVLDYGAIVRCMYVPDRHGRLLDVVLGFDDIASYENDHFYIGAAIGRYANRIRNGTFVLDGETCRVSVNNGTNHLHGGERGFDKVVWKAQTFESEEAAGVVLEHRSPDGDQGFPGDLDVQITYTLSSANVFSVDYHATSARATPVSLTHHSYFNLAGEGTGDILGHELTIYADAFTGIDENLVPTGRIVPVEGTPFDFRQSQEIGARIRERHEQLLIARGYDHNFVLADSTRALSKVARVFQRDSGIEMQVSTTEPGMQFYSGNFLKPVHAGKHGNVYDERAGFCLETQHFPDSPNHPEFPSTILRPGDELRSRTEYRFSIR